MFEEARCGRARPSAMRMMAPSVPAMKITGGAGMK